MNIMNNKTVQIIIFVILGILVIKFMPFWVLALVGLGYLYVRYKTAIHAFFKDLLK